MVYYYLYKSRPGLKGTGRVGVGPEERSGVGARRCMFERSIRGGPKVKFGRHKAVGNALRIQQEPDREKDPEVSIITDGEGAVQGLSVSKVRNRTISALFSILLGWGLYQWGVIPWK